MKITVQFFAQARLAAGMDRLTVEVPLPCTPSQAMRAVAEGREELRRFLFGEDDEPRRSNLLLLGQQRIAWDSTQSLAEGDCITLLPPIAGG